MPISTSEYQTALLDKLERISASKCESGINRTIALDDLFGIVNFLYFAADNIKDTSRIDWLHDKCRGGSVTLLINGVPKGQGQHVREAIDDAVAKDSK